MFAVVGPHVVVTHMCVNLYVPWELDGLDGDGRPGGTDFPVGRS